MSIWSTQDVARDAVRRQAGGLDTAQIAARTAEAAARARETAADARGALRRGTDLPGVEIDMQRLADTWAAKHTEWQRIQTLLETTGRAMYEPADDETGTRWERERGQHREERLAAAAAHREQVRQDRLAVAVQLRLTPAQAAPLQQAAVRTGLTPEQVLAQLAARVETAPDGALSVSAFHHGHP
ncbi:hypothetical protein GCM10017562_01010 [Streptomyces roseofulvus]|uniref:hypothetical protein n=1 Tax=Streptomyces roseofulvus TaxID=33902 RepID=UPI0031F7C1D9